MTNQTETPEQHAETQAERDHKERVRLYGEQLAREIEETQQKRAAFKAESAFLSEGVKASLLSWAANNNAQDFAFGISNLKDAHQNKKNPNVVDLVSVSGSKFCYMQDEKLGEFIGLAKKRAMNPKLAEDIMKTAIGRGWTSVQLHGSEEDKAIMYREALKLGLIVQNYAPNGPQQAQPQTQEDTAEPKKPAATTTELSPVVLVTPSKFTGGEVVQRTSKYAPEDIIEGEFTVVEKDQKSLSGPKKPQGPLLLGHDK